MATPWQRRPTRIRPQVPLRAAPYVGMRDSVDPSNVDPLKAALLQNCYPNPAGDGPPVIGRPGFQQAGSALAGAGRVQVIYQFTELDGTEHTIAIAGGRFFTFDWGTRTWTETLEAADFSGAGITVDTAARIYAVTFANQAIFSDGVNKPWAWDGTAGGGLTPITNASGAWYGRPRVYYAKLFGILAADRSAFEWSEENDPTTGYQAGGFNNAWTLGQTDQNRLFALHGTNEALYYWRARSAGAVVGAANDDFASSGTHDAVSDAVGTESPGAIVQHERSLFFLDSDARPHRIVVGGGLQPLWSDCFETVRRIPKSTLAQAVAVDWTPGGLVLIGYTALGATENNRVLVFDAESGQFAGVWDGFEFTALAMCKDDAGAPVLMHGTTDGRVYDWGSPEGTIWTDDGVEIAHVVEGATLGYDEALEKRFDRADLTLRLESDMTHLAFDFVTPAGRAAAQSFDVQGTYAVWGVFEWGVDPLGGVPVDQHQAVGLNGQGRWIRPRLRHSGLGEKFGFVDWGITAIPLGRTPQAR